MTHTPGLRPLPFCFRPPQDTTSAAGRASPTEDENNIKTNHRRLRLGARWNGYINSNKWQFAIVLKSHSGRDVNEFEAPESFPRSVGKCVVGERVGVGDAATR